MPLISTHVTHAILYSFRFQEEKAFTRTDLNAGLLALHKYVHSFPFLLTEFLLPLGQKSGPFMPPFCLYALVDYLYINCQGHITLIPEKRLVIRSSAMHG